MHRLYKDALVYQKGRLCESDIMLSHQMIVEKVVHDKEDVSVFSLKGKLLIPGLVDVHVHLREPGFSYKETILTGTRSAACGGYTSVCAMPNLNPPPDTLQHLNMQQTEIENQAVVRVYPYGCITMGQKGEGELVDFETLAPHVVGFSDDGRGIQDEDTMRRAMYAVKRANGMMVAHCEDNSLLHGGYIHDGMYAKKHGHRGICSESEWRQVERDVRLAAEVGCRYHVCHVSTKESVNIIRKAKRDGVDVSCETAPHYLLLTDEMLQDDGRFKMNPPIRSKADREALCEGLADGTVDIIATDHAPHADTEKDKGLVNSHMGVVGLECAFATLYTGLVKTGFLPLEKLLYAMIDAPRNRFLLPSVQLVPGDIADMTVFDLEKRWQINSKKFLSKGRATPFDGVEVWGQCEWTMVGGKVVWKRK